MQMDETGIARTLRSGQQDQSTGTPALRKSGQMWETAISPWTVSAGKRVFDLACAVPLALVTLPLMVCIAVAIRLSSPGPVLFRQQRCGRDGHEFELLKFRTMHHRREQMGPGVTRSGDARVTRIGCLLRQWKLDELPQFFNVLSGDMSMVGPRPDLAEYLAHLPPRLRGLPHLRPGITGWATLRYRNEEQALASVPADRLNDFYVRALLPRKARLDWAYAQRATLWTDLSVLSRTLLAIVKKPS
jgi:lipopolysaccharide/colanic/teichoic acid biosynthesis glycosyltransferase